MRLKLGVPSKGRLQEETIRWFAARGVGLTRTGAEREYAGRVEGEPGIELVLLSAGEIPRELGAGRLHLGVTGQDVVREQIAGWDRVLGEVAPMGFGFADLVVAVPAFWVDVRDMADLDSVAAEFRARHGHRLRVATKYHHLVRGFFRAHGVADFQLVDSQGATEGAVKNLTAEAVADITSTGSTLRDNHLRILDDGLILRSQATLFVSGAAPWDARARGILAEFRGRLGCAGAEAPGGLTEDPPAAPPRHDMEAPRGGHLLWLACLAPLVGVASGLIGASFLLSLQAAERFRVGFIAWARPLGPAGPVLAILAAAVAVALATWMVRRFSPHATGSGIPHVEAVIEGDLPPAPARLLVVKFFGGVLAIGSGLALGREGPSVQMGAGIAHLVGRLFRRSWEDAAC